MPSIVDSCKEAVNDDFAFIKFFIYAIPVYVSLNLYVKKSFPDFYYWLAFSVIMVLLLISRGIYNVTNGKKEILPLNPLKLFMPFIKLSLILGPQVVFYYYVYEYLTKYLYSLPLVSSANLQSYVGISVFALIIMLMAAPFFLFSRFQKIIDGYNLKLIYIFSFNIFLMLVFALVQLLIIEAIFTGFVAYVFFCFKIPLINFVFLAYCSVFCIIKASILAVYASQYMYEQVKSGRTEEEDFTIGPVIDE